MCSSFELRVTYDPPKENVLRVIGSQKARDYQRGEYSFSCTGSHLQEKGVFTLVVAFRNSIPRVDLIRTQGDVVCDIAKVVFHNRILAELLREVHQT